MKRTLLTLGASAALVLLTACGVEDDHSPVGAAAPDFEIQTLQSASIKRDLKSFRGKVVLLDFWATWCGPCRQILPTLEGFYQKYRGQGLEAMAITDEERAKVLSAEAAHPHRLPVYLDPNRLASDAYGVTSLPTIVVVGKNGKVVYATAGFGPTTADEIERSIVDALKG